MGVSPTSCLPRNLLAWTSISSQLTFRVEVDEATSPQYNSFGKGLVASLRSIRKPSCGRLLDTRVNQLSWRRNVLSGSTARTIAALVAPFNLQLELNEVNVPEFDQGDMVQKTWSALTLYGR